MVIDGAAFSFCFHPQSGSMYFTEGKKWTKETNINRRLAKTVLWRTARLMPLFTTGYQATAAIHMPFMAVVFLTGIFELTFELFNSRSYCLSAERESQGDINICLFVTAHSVHLWNAFFFLLAPSLILPIFLSRCFCIYSIVTWVFLKHLALYWWSRTKKPNQSHHTKSSLYFFFFL